MGSSITAISYAIPQEKLTHAELCERFGTAAMEKIAKLSGILERRIAPQGICTSDLAMQAAELLFKNQVASPEDFDMLMLATQTPDYLLPTTACILQDKLGLPKTCAAFDINLGCSQFIYALATAKAWINCGMAKKVLLLAGDTPSKLINPRDRSAVSLFGDSAVACIVEKSQKESLIDFVFGTDGSGYQDLIAPTSAMRNQPEEKDYIEREDENQNIRSNVNLYINGFKIFNFAYKIIPQSVNEILKKNSLSIDDIAMFVFHQAGEKIVKSAANRLKIPPQKVWYKMHDIGNCGGASPAIAMADAVIHGRLKGGDKIVMCAFGVGLSWGAALIEVPQEGIKAFTNADYSDSPQKPASQTAADL